MFHLKIKHFKPFLTICKPFQRLKEFDEDTQSEIEKLESGIQAIGFIEQWYRHYSNTLVCTCTPEHTLARAHLSADQSRWLLWSLIRPLEHGFMQLPVSWNLQLPVSWNLQLTDCMKSTIDRLYESCYKAICLVFWDWSRCLFLCMCDLKFRVYYPVHSLFHWVYCLR